MIHNYQCPEKSGQDFSNTSKTNTGSIRKLWRYCYDKDWGRKRGSPTARIGLCLRATVFGRGRRGASPGEGVVLGILSSSDLTRGEVTMSDVIKGSAVVSDVIKGSAVVSDVIKSRRSGGLLPQHHLETINTSCPNHCLYLCSFTDEYFVLILRFVCILKRVRDL